MILPPAPWRDRPGLDRLTAALDAAEGRVRYVGGAVRDTVLGLPVADLDLATSLHPEEVAARVRAAGFKAVPTGLAHGTITAVVAGAPIEVTTLRRDVATDGRHAEVAFTDDWQEDAARRDFTINALSADPVSGRIHDYFGGLVDLERGVVRFIGAPLARIAEDHLRILRYFRFHARFGRGEPDAASLDACIARANDLMTLSRERIAQELLKLLAVADPASTVALMVAHGVLRPVLPEITDEGAARLARLAAREASRGATDPLRRLAALLPPDMAVAEAVATRLRLSNAQRKRLARLATAAAATDPQGWRVLAYRLGREVAQDRALLSAPDAGLDAALGALADWEVPRLPIGGGRLVAMGLSQGPEVAEVLQAVERAWLDEGFPPPARVEAIAAALVDQRKRARR